MLIRVWSGLLTLWMLAMARGVFSLASAGPDERYMYAASTVWKLLSLGGVAWVFWSGGRSVPAYWLIALGQLVWILAGVLAPQPQDNSLFLNLVNLAIFYGPLVALRPQRRQLLRPGLQPSAPLLALAVLAALPLVFFALRVADRYSGSELGFDMTGLYLLLAAASLYAALRPRGSWLPYAVAVGAAWTGLAAVLLPNDDASPGRAAGVLLLTWAAALAAAVARAKGRFAGHLDARPHCSRSRSREPLLPRRRPRMADERLRRRRSRCGQSRCSG